MYEPILLVHSWTRWIVLLALIYFFLRCLKGWIKNEKWGASEAAFMRGFHQAYGFQVLFGLALWSALSPVVHAFFMDRSLLSTPLVNFWALRHPGEMLFAFVVFQIAASRAKRAKNRFRAYSITFGLVLVLIAMAIPWPWLATGRPLFRF